MRPGPARLLRRVALGVAAAYAAMLIAVWCFQERLLFHPEPLPAEHRFAFGDDVHETTVSVDGAELSALHLERPGARGLVFFLHGNGGNLDGWFSNAQFYRDVGFDVFMIDYRGYGKSTGSIESEAQLHADVRAAYELIAPRYAGRPIVIQGRSLGTGLAAALALEVDPALTVLVSPYRSILAMSDQLYPFIPFAIVRYPLRTEAFVPAIEGPVLMLHGEQDELIPVAHAEAILAAAPTVQLLRIPGAGHDDVHASALYRAALGAALTQL